MFIEIKEIGPEGLAVDRTIEAFRLPLQEEEAIEVERSRLVGDLSREGGGIAFSGDIETAARLTCSRCLERYVQPLDLHFDLLYTTSPERAAPGESRMEEELITVTPFDGVRIDLSALLAEQIDLGLPLKPLCRPECRGLCPRCGSNRNVAACGCPDEETGEPRLRILKDLR
jgi:uncharacterized protein